MVDIVVKHKKWRYKIDITSGFANVVLICRYGYNYEAFFRNTFISLLIMKSLSRKFCLALSCSLFLLQSFSQVKSVSIRIVQGDSVYIPQAARSSVVLQKKGFRIQILLQNIGGVYAFASMRDSVYNIADESPVPGFAEIPSMIITEEKFNVEKELMVSNEGWCYWFYDPKLSWHGFNKKIISLDSGRVVGIKTVKELHFMPSGKTMKLKDNNEPLYLFFVAVDEIDANGKPSKELLRKRIRIDWIDED
jgi:hypothetical protein